MHNTERNYGSSKEKTTKEMIYADPTPSSFKPDPVITMQLHADSG
jgi:hypothetical protein